MRRFSTLAQYGIFGNKASEVISSKRRCPRAIEVRRHERAATVQKAGNDLREPQEEFANGEV